jgi:cytosine/creatinine deaminase
MEDFARSEELEKQGQERALVASFFVGMLTAIAFQETVNPIRAEIRSTGASFGMLALVLAFSTTCLRFFIGNQLHLLKRSWQAHPGYYWFFDFTVVTLQTMALIFMGGLVSVEENRGSTVDFMALLAALFISDFIWWAIRELQIVRRPSLRELEIPKPWAFVNLILAVPIVILAGQTFGAAGHWHAEALYQGKALPLIVCLISLVVFAYDALHVDHHGLFKRFSPPEHKAALEEALEEAKSALARGDFPSGAVFLEDGSVTARASNQVETTQDVYAHAALNCLKQLAGRSSRNAVLVVTSHPCELCAIRIKNCGVKQLLIGDSKISWDRDARVILESAGVDIILLNNSECTRLLHEFRTSNRSLWEKIMNRGVV